jgi:hypothetical protein
MASPLSALSRTAEQCRIRREVLEAGRITDARALPYTEGQAVVDRGAIAPATLTHPDQAA